MRKIVFIGPESTGKTTLAASMAKYYQSAFVPEFSRLYAEKVKRPLTYDDVKPIIEGQLKLEDTYCSQNHNLLFFDTNILQTKVYSEWYYNKTPNYLNDIINQRVYDLYFLNYIDVPWENDGIRDQPHHRLELFFKFIAELNHKQLPFSILKGSNEKKMLKVSQHINQLFT